MLVEKIERALSHAEANTNVPGSAVKHQMRLPSA